MAWAQQVEPETKVWYESFFQRKKLKSPEKTVDGYKNNLQRARETHDQAAEAHILKTLGLIQLTQFFDYDSAMTYLMSALAIEDSLRLLNEQAISHIGLARILEDVGDYTRSAEHLEQALNATSSSNTINHIWISGLLGKVNAARNNLAAAAQNYQEVLDESRQSGDRATEAEALFNLGHLMSQKKDYDEALKFHKEALKIRRDMGDKKLEARSLNDIGELFRLQNNHARALENHIVALDIRKELKDKQALAESFNNIGEICYLQKSYARAIANLNLALDAAQDAQDKLQLRKSYEYLSLAHEASGNYKLALQNRNNFIGIDDFIQRESSERQLLEAQNRYVLEKKEGQIGKLEADKKLSEAMLKAELERRNILIALIVLGVIVLALVYYLYTVKRKSNEELKEANTKVTIQNEQLQDLNATKDKFFSIISHDLKGPLNSLTSFSGLLMNHTDSLSKEEIKMLAQDLDKSVKNLFALLENLLEWARSQTGAIEFKAEPFEIQPVLEDNKNLLTAQAQNKKITIELTSQVNATVLAHKNSIHTVVRNLISNAIKFTPEGGVISVGSQLSNKEIVVSIADTGVGMSADMISKLFRIDTKVTTKGTAQEKGTGLGLILCKEFIEKNGGRIWVKSEEGKGSVFFFTVPLSGQ
jgi:signal transduction histidine kinase/uncharacterized protein HemY